MNKDLTNISQGKKREKSHLFVYVECGSLLEYIYIQRKVTSSRGTRLHSDSQIELH